MNPPLRTKRHANSLWKGLKEGIINCIATDHSPHTLNEKKKPFGIAPSGMPGVETSLALMLDKVNRNECTLNEVVYWMSKSPAQIYKMIRKGSIGNVKFNANRSNDQTMDSSFYHYLSSRFLPSADETVDIIVEHFQEYNYA